MKSFSTAASGQTASGTLMPPAAPDALSGTLAIKTLLLGVKLTAVLILTACLQVSAKTRAQKLSLSLKNSSLEKLFTGIGKKTSYVFFYDVAISNDT